MSASMTGPDGGTMNTENVKNGPNLCGKATEATVCIDRVETTALLDTGSCVSTIGKSFYDQNLDHLPLLPVTDILQVECADGQKLPYVGYIKASLSSSGIPQCQELFCLFLVVPDTNYNLRVPVLIGTNILNEIVKDCKIQHGEQYLQKANLQTPWYLSMRCMSVRQRELRRNKNRLAVVRSAESAKFTIGPNQSVNIRGYLDKQLEYNSTSAIIQEYQESILPDYLDITPTVIHYEYRKNDEVNVNISNLTTNSITISPKEILGEVQPVTVDESVFDRLEKKISKKIFDTVNINSNLAQEQDEKVRLLLQKHIDIFSKDDSDIGDCDMIKHRIDLIDDIPFKQRHRRIPPSMIDEVRKHIEELLSGGIIRKSKSPWASNVVLVRKKNGKLRLCVDYRMLNKKTVKDSYALPRVEEVFDILDGAKLFSTIDMKSGYHQVSVEESHKCRTAFTVGPLGFFEYNKMPFGLSNSPATYQRLMEECLGELNMKICVIYLDDLIIFSDSFEQHLERLDIVLTRLQQCNLKLSPDKCFFLQERVKFLGHVVSAEGIETDPDKIEKIKNWPRPSNSDELRSFVAFTGYYRRFVKDFSKITKPLTDLLPPTTTKKNAKIKTKEWRWEEAQEETFNKLKDILSSPPILAYPDFQKPFELHTDASGKGLGAILYQTQDDRKKVIAYASRSLSKPEKNYSAFKLEFLALKWAITEKFSDYLLNSHFTVYTDNNPLTHILSSAKLDATGQRWASSLGQFDFDIIYRAGLNNKDADGLSRYPFEKVEETEEVKIEDKTVKTICQSTQIEALIEVLPSASINIVDATECPGQPLAQVEQREIRKNQREDSVLGKWVRATIDKRFPRDYSFSKEDQIMRKSFQYLKMIRGVLYREVKDDNNTIQQLVLPKVYHRTVMQGLHNDVGHPGRDRTLSLIRERFFWPKMTADIDKWTSECRRCLARKSPTNSRAPLVNIVTTYPLELICMDYLTLEPAKGLGNILVITDHFTKYALAIATKNQTAKTTAEAFYQYFITNYGIPTRIHSDQGANFESEIIKELCKLTGMTKSRTSSYHPMGNPIPERFNRTLLDMLGTLEPDKKSDWRKYLPSLTYAYNCTKHETTKISPHELMFGRKPKLPIDSLFDTPVQDNSSKTTKEYIKDLKKRMKNAQDIANKMTEKARIKMKSQYDKKAKAVKINIGDKVLVKILKFEGKHKIEDKYENTIYTVIGQPNENIPVFDVKSEDGTVKRLHRNHLFLLSFMQHDSDEGMKGDADTKDVGNKGNQNIDKTPDQGIEEDIDKESSTQEIYKEEKTNDTDEDDEDSVIEFVPRTSITGDAWKTGSHLFDQTERPVPETDTEKKGRVENKIELGAVAEEKVVEERESGAVKFEKKSDSGSKKDTVESMDPDTTTIIEATDKDDTDLQTETEVEKVTEGFITKTEETEVKGVEGELRRSRRNPKPPKRYDEYYMNLMTNRPVDRRLQTLQKLLGSGILNDLDSDMTHSILDAVMR